MTASRVLIMTSVAFGLLAEHALPYFHGRRLFGVAMPVEARAELMRRYELQLLPWTIASLIAAVFLPLAWCVWVAVAVSGIATIRAYARSYTAARRFAAPDSGVREAALSDAGGDVRRVASHLLPPLVIPGAVALYLRAHWDQIPPRWAVHWTMDGIPNGWSYKTVAGIYGPLLFGALIILFMAGVCLAILVGSRRGSATSPVVSVMTAVAYAIAASFSLGGVLALHYVPMWVVVSMVVGYFIVLGGIIFRTMRATSDASPDDITPDECWRGGQFYYNPEDPALFVQTRVGSAYTLNFGNRASWFLAGLMILYLGAMVCLARALWG
jgi:uncharacterized membrane protein